MKKALIFRGGWEGHEPAKVSERFSSLLSKHAILTEIVDGVECLADREKLLEYDLIVACYTMGKLPKEYSKNVSYAVGHGVGLAGCHGGMCDAFRESTEWQFMTGGQWVSHPGGDGVEYTVNICHGSSPIVEGLSDFTVKSEHYYLHIDPSIEVLATTRVPLVNYYHAANKPVNMPVAWTKYWGCGRVFYTSLGHHDDVFENSPTASLLMERGMLWAIEGKDAMLRNGIDPELYENKAKMY